ncbi:hypothetical protein EV561_10116 [Rhizobium sp. BK376]|nr:hypothetical protein EV561_10116 [Rhizobium sp. BK376]
MLVASALVALTTTSCTSFGAKQLPDLYPSLPADLRVCFDKATPAPPKGILTKAAVIDLIAKLHLSETQKIDCGKRLINFYDNLRGTHV